MTAAVLSSNSAYREIRSAFRAEDDVDALAGTVRAWVIGMYPREILTECQAYASF
jgi:hypothetical protein